MRMSTGPPSGARAGNPECARCKGMAARRSNAHTVTCSDCTGGECPLCGELTLRWTGKGFLGCPECNVHWPGAVILSHEAFAEAKAKWGWPDWERVRNQIRSEEREHRAAQDLHPPWHGSPMAWVRIVGQRIGDGVSMVPSAGAVRTGRSDCPGCRAAVARYVTEHPRIPRGVPVALTCLDCSEPAQCPLCEGAVRASEHIEGGSWRNPGCEDCGATALPQDP